MQSKFIVGRDLTLPINSFDVPPRLVASPDSPPHFEEVVATRYQINHAIGVFHKVSKITTGDHAKAHRNFCWLPWIPGKISYVPLDITRVLTGPFTGCWVVLFKLKGRLCAGHIGTDSNAAHENSRQVKEAWLRAVNSGMIQPIKAVNPVRELPMLSYQGAPSFYALVGIDQEIDLITLTRPFKGGAPHQQTIAQVHQANTQPAPQFI